VDLPSGAVVGLTFAAGVGTALVVTRLHRRRRHRTPPTGPDLGRSEPPPAPTIRRLRRVDLGREAGSPDPEQAPDQPTRLHLFPLASTGRIVLGARDDQEITVPIGGLVVGLEGPGGIAVARALLLTLLMHAGDHDVEIITPRADATRVLALNPEEVDELTQYVRALRVTADLSAALRLLESERIHRARLLDTAPDSHDLAAVRQADPTEPLPHLVLVATPAPEQQRRLEAVTVAASDYDMAIITLGEHPVGPTVHLDDAAKVTSSAGAGTELWDGLRLFHVEQQDADQVLDLIRSAHGAPEPEAEPQPVAQAETAGRSRVPVARSAPHVPQEAQAGGDRPVYLQVLGHPTVRVDGQILETGIRGKGRELLTHLAVHAEGASRDAIVAALWPDVDHKHAVMRFHALLHETRQTLKRATGRIDENFIVRTADRYGIDPELISVDLWRFHTGLHEASQVERDQEQAALLQEAVDIYEGHLAAEASYEQAYEWIEPERETLRRQAVEALIHLAILYERHEPERALMVLERARSLDRYAEEIYQHIMTLQAKLGRSDAIRRTYRLLETSLEDLAVDPSEETQQLLWRLLHPRGRSQTGQR
jgi:DNA-binding SARP family transcriptional activator